MVLKQYEEHGQHDTDEQSAALNVVPQLALVRKTLLAHHIDPDSHALGAQESHFNLPNALLALYQHLRTESGTHASDTTEEQARWFHEVVDSFSRLHRCPLALYLFPEHPTVQPYAHLWSDLAQYMGKTTEASRLSALQTTQHILERAIYSGDYLEQSLTQYAQGRVYRSTLQQVLTTTMQQQECSVTQEFLGWNHYFFRAQSTLIDDLLAALKTHVASEATRAVALACFECVQKTLSELIVKPNQLLSVRQFRSRLSAALKDYQVAHAGEPNVADVVTALLRVMAPLQRRVQPVDVASKPQVVMPMSIVAPVPIVAPVVVVPAPNVINQGAVSAQQTARRASAQKSAPKKRAMISSSRLPRTRSWTVVLNLTSAAYLASVVLTKGATLAAIPGIASALKGVAVSVISGTGMSLGTLKISGLLAATVLDSLLLTRAAMTTARFLQRPQRAVKQPVARTRAVQSTEQIDHSEHVPTPSPWRHLLHDIAQPFAATASVADAKPERDLDLFGLMSVKRSQAAVTLRPAPSLQYNVTP
jgi:hypothetical protein